MVVVVEAVAHGDQAEQPVVAAAVAGVVVLRAVEVADRIDGEGDLEDHDRAEGVAPEEARLTVDEIARRGTKQAGDHPEAVEPDEFGEAGEIADQAAVGLHQVLGEEPADVAVEEAADDGRMHVLFGVGVRVVDAVVDDPPERAFLKSRAAGEGEQELEPARGLEGVVREVAVVADGDAEAGDPRHDHEEDDAGDGDRHIEERDEREVDRDQRRQRQCDPHRAVECRADLRRGRRDHQW